MSPTPRAATKPRAKQRATPAAPTPVVLDPVTRYATDVVAGTIIAGRLVRLACQRHLTDLAQQTTKGLLWKPEDAQEAIDFFPAVLCLPEETDVDEDVEASTDVRPETGTPFVLTPFQQFIVGSLYGWHLYVTSKTTGARRLQQRFRIAYFEGGKGCGKTPMGAGLLILMLVRHGVRGAQLFCAAVTKEQAQLAFADCLKMVQASPALSTLIKETVNNLAVPATGSFIRPISSEKRGLDGKRVQGAVIDELHEHPSGLLVAKIRAGIKGRPNALIFLPTNAGFDLESVCWEYHDYSRQVLEGTLVNEAWFAYICHLDACETCHTAGKLQPSDECPDCDDWKVEGPHWLKANPNLGVSIPWQYLRDQVREGIDIPSQRNIVRRLNFCQWTQQRTAWITPEAWAACAGAITRTSLLGRECFLGIDLSDKIDLSSVVAIFPRALERRWEDVGTDLGVEDGAQPCRHPRCRRTVDGDASFCCSGCQLAHLGGYEIHADGPLGHTAACDDRLAATAPAVHEDRPTIDCAFDVLSFFWMPTKTLHRRAQEDKIPYPDWAKDGHVTTTPGSLIDHDAIVEFIIGTLATQYQIRGIGIDQAGAAGAVSKLRRQFGDALVEEIPQGFRRLSEPSKLVEALILTGNLAHDQNPAMAMCVTNMGKEENAWREIRPVKIAQRKRIDGGVALIDALAIKTATSAPSPSVYARRGALVITTDSGASA